MNLHEYQSKRVLKEFGLPVLDGYLCYTPGEAEAAADNLGTPVCVVKAQVHAGGRGKGGGVKLAKSSAEARQYAEEILGMHLITPQTSKEGKLVRKVYVEAGCEIKNELYLSLLVDRTKKAISVVASAEGGTEIEVVAENTPEKIKELTILPEAGLQSFQGVELGLELGLPIKLARKFSQVLGKLYQAFIEKDLSMIEINPLVITEDDQIMLLDAKCSVDDNALFRHPDLKLMLDYDELDSRDLEAEKHDLAYVGLDGSIACMVNGAGLAMATMDIIKFNGAEPANFLDVGGGADEKKVAAAFKILLADDNVRGILINIFGGIMRCDVLAEGVVSAAKEIGVQVPLVVRLQGTNVEQGREILKNSGLKIETAETMQEASAKIIELTA